MKAEEVHKCAKCGLCQTKCPVYREVLNESEGPRAKVQLIKHYAEHDLASSKNLNRIVAKCLMCGNCTAHCPSGLRHDALFMRMRSQMIDDFGEHWQMRFVYHLLTHGAQLNLATKIARWGHSVALRNLAREIKIGTIPLKRLPAFNRQPFRNQVEAVIHPKSASRGKVLYFTGCGTNYVYEDIGSAVVHVLNRLGFEVEIPQDQVCCGLPMFFHGNLKKARANILENIGIFDRPDIKAVVVDCATCGAALRKEWIHVLEEMDSNTANAQRLSKKVQDITEFVFGYFDLLAPLLDQDQPTSTVTYHSPCHLRNDQGIQSQIEALLDSIPTIIYKRSADFDTCCGGGGTFFMDFPEISKRIVEKKIKNAKATGADILATGCPGCRLNLAGNLTESDPMRVLHPIQLISNMLP